MACAFTREATHVYSQNFCHGEVEFDLQAPALIRVWLRHAYDSRQHTSSRSKEEWQFHMCGPLKNGESLQRDKSLCGNPKRFCRDRVGTGLGTVHFAVGTVGTVENKSQIILRL